MVKNVRVSSISFLGTGRAPRAKETVRRNLKAMADLLEKAYYDESDIVCFPEVSPTLGLSIEESIALAESVPGPIFDFFSSKACEYNMNIILPMLELADGHVYNSAILIGRDGRYLGSYHKVHPTIGEIEAGITPGFKAKVLESEFGPLGFAICFDLNFRDVVEVIANSNTKLVFFPSAYPGGLQLSIWAFDYGVYIVSSLSSEGSVIVDPLGRILARSSSYNLVICKTLNLDYEVLHLYYNYEKLVEVKRKYGSKVEIDVSRPEAVFIFASNMEEKSVEEIIAEFNLETRSEYFNRSNRVRANALRKKSLV